MDYRSARTDLISFAQALRAVYNRIVKPRLDVLIRAQSARIGAAAGRIGRDLEARLRDR